MMGRTLRAGALALCILAAAACSHKDKNAPLAFVPADTPFVVANLKPLDKDMQATLLKKLNARLPYQVKQWNETADTLRQDGKTDEANLLQALAAEFKGKTYQQVSADAGLDLHGLSAVYGVGLSPVIRAQLSDPDKFDAFVKRLETSYGRTFEVSKLDGVSYQHTTLGKNHLQAVIATDHKQAIIALLPASADKALLGKVLGTKRPQKSVQDSERLKDLADKRDYLPYVVGYLDTTKLPALLTSGKDPMLAALSDKDDAPQAMPASCESDLARIASRVPLLSFGYTKLDAKHMSTKFEADMAPDITKALSGVKVALPGLGGDLDAPLDMALGLPLPKLRSFWDAQADAVAAKPFTCPKLTSLNSNFAKLRQSLQKTAIPPFGDLRGLRLSLQQLGETTDGKPQPVGAIVIGSSNPQGLIAIAQAMLPSLAKANLEPDGKPVALSGRITAITGEPTWIAMSKDAIAIGVGKGENTRLGDLLNAPEGDAGTMFKWHVNGPMYAKLVQMFGDKMGGYMQAHALRATAGDDDKDAQKAAASAKQFKQGMAQMHAEAKDIKSMDATAKIDDRGLIVTTTVDMK